MNLNAYIDRQDWFKGPLMQRAIIVFNGKVVKDVVEADEEHGFIWQMKRDSLGNFIVKDDELVRIRRQGRVRIIDPLNVDLAGVYLK